MFASATLAPGLRLSLAPSPRSYRLGFVPLSEASLCALQPPAHSFLVVLAEAACLGSSWISPLCFPVCRYAYKATCAELPHVSGLSFVLGNISFWLGFGRCLIFLFAPCGCRRTYCGPHCGSESARVLVSLGSSLSGVRHLSHVCSSVWGHVGVAHPFHPSLLLGGVLVRFCGGPNWRPLAMSWACLPPFICVGLVYRSRSHCCPSRAVSLLTVSVF